MFRLAAGRLSSLTHCNVRSIQSVFQSIQMKNLLTPTDSESSRGFRVWENSALQLCSRKNQSICTTPTVRLPPLTHCNVRYRSIWSVFQSIQTKNLVISPTDSESLRGFRVWGNSPFRLWSKKNQSTCTPTIATSTNDITPKASLSTFKILSYNVWLRDLELRKRMESLGFLIQKHLPDVICFQEVTSNSYKIFQKSSWWNSYICSSSPESIDRRYFSMQLSKLPVKSFIHKPFTNSYWERELCVAEVDDKEGNTLVIATGHLEGHVPQYDISNIQKRKSHAKEAFTYLKNSTNVIFCGDMNWDDEMDGEFPLPHGWVDAWEELRPEEDGFTFDTESNSMLSANFQLRKRLDRHFCKLQDYELTAIEMIGREAIPGIEYPRAVKVQDGSETRMLPVLPSDHYGLLLTTCRK